MRHVSDSQPGIRRRRAGRGFTYLDEAGHTIRDRAVRKRIEGLVIPPAWTEVWICPDPQGHLQATGFDDRGRKQYLYHPDWRSFRQKTKYHRIVQFGQRLPTLRRKVERDLQAEGMGRRKVLAVTVRLLERTLIRVGNDQYQRVNDTYGLTTLRSRHVRIHGSEVTFHYRGKGGKNHEVTLDDRRLAGVVRKCRQLAGHELFTYRDEEGSLCDVGSGDVNEYLRDAMGDSFTAKDIRTWAGTLEAARALREFGDFTSKTQAKKNLVAAVKAAAARLRNRPATARKHYIHPAVLEAYARGSQILPERSQPSGRIARTGLSADENSLLQFLQRWERHRQAR